MINNYYCVRPTALRSLYFCSKRADTPVNEQHNLHEQNTPRNAMKTDANAAADAAAAGPTQLLPRRFKPQHTRTDHMSLSLETSQR